MDCGSLRMAGGNGGFHPFILTLLLVLSHLVFFNAVPTSGTRALLLYETQDSTASGYTHQINTLDVVEKEELIIRGRLDLAHIDYEGAGPNTRHTPPPKV